MLEAIIIYLSFIFGKALHLLTKEEVKQGKKYITTAKNILIISAAALIYFNNFELSSFLFLLFGFIIFIFLKKIHLLAYHFYLLIGLAAFLSLLSSNPVLLLSFIFLLTIMQSSLSSLNKKEFISASIYFVLPFSLILIENFINANLNIFTGFVAGGLLAQLKGP